MFLLRFLLALYPFTPVSGEVHSSFDRALDRWVAAERLLNPAIRVSDSSPIERGDTFQVPYLEIPYQSISPYIAINQLPSPAVHRLAPLVQFERDGQQWIRWFLHPLATSPPDILVMFSNLTPQRSPRFLGRLSASRSLFIKDVELGLHAKIKVSLPGAQGPWSDKRILIRHLRAWVTHNKILSHALDPSDFFAEPLALGIMSNGGEDGFVIREIEPHLREGHTLLPVFSALHENEGRRLAALNGSSNPAQYWRENLLMPLARLQARVRAKAGAEHTSPHSQNFLLELDVREAPTGRIILQDLDFYIDDIYARKLAPLGFWQDPRGIVAEEVALQNHRYALLHGLGSQPTWLSERDHQTWVSSYFLEFANEFNNLMNLKEGGIKVKRVFRSVSDQAAPTSQVGFSRPGESRIYFIELSSVAKRVAERIGSSVIEGFRARACESLAKLRNKILQKTFR